MAKPKTKTQPKKSAATKVKATKATGKSKSAKSATGKGKAAAKAKPAKATPRYLVLVFCGRKYKSLITTLATPDRREAEQEARFLVANSVSEKGDNVDVAVFNTSFPWDDKKGWKFFS